jgi:hypothetical protein
MCVTTQQEISMKLFDIWAYEYVEYDTGYIVSTISLLYNEGPDTTVFFKVSNDTVCITTVGTH